MRNLRGNVRCRGCVGRLGSPSPTIGPGKGRRVPHSCPGVGATDRPARAHPHRWRRRLGDRRPGRPGRDDPLPRPADGHPDDRVLGRRRAPPGASSATRTSSTTPGPGRWRSSRSTTAPSGNYQGVPAAVHAQRRQPVVARLERARRPTPSSSTPRTATSTSRWRPSGSTPSPPTAASARPSRSRPRTASASRRLLHLRQHGRARRGVRGHARAAAPTRRRCAG